MTDNLEIITGAKGVGSSTLDDFREAGFTSAEEVGSCTPEELADEVKGVGYSTAISVLKFLEGEGYRDTSNRDDDLERLVELLQDLFEFDNKDRDFGIYKLMNANREKIEQYIKEDLIDKIEDDVRDLHDEIGSRPEEEIKEDVINELGGDAFDGNSLSQEALDEIDKRTEGPSEEELENIRSEIYNHIYQFLSNYYDSGDFITQRKRTNRSEPYSIPYDGSNTHFHWVTKNQYYSKTSEQFTRFTFNSGGYNICFKTVEDELEDSGVGNSEYLVIGAESDIEVKDDSVIIPFYHRMIGDEDLERFDISSSTHNKQSAMNDKFSDILADYLDEKEVSVSRELVGGKIDEYTTRNQNDFFIHKNIENFLTEELEEYVKSEVFTYDPDAGVDSVSDLSMEKGRIINDIIKDIISFVSQLEEFKRKLFEKKKFVKNSEKLVQLKNIPEDNYDTILENEEQLSGWEESYNIDSSDLNSENMNKYPYSEMTVDTKYFEENITTGKEPKNKLIKGDNYQAIRFLKEKYKDSVKCIYIDPPYNTGNANFAYKDDYQKPTWLSMMYDRIRASKKLLQDEGTIFVSIGEDEVDNLRKILDTVFGRQNMLAELTVVTNWSGNKDRTGFTGTHEYVLSYAKDIEKCDIGGIPLTEDEMEEWNKDEYGIYKLAHNLLATGKNAPRDRRPNLYFPLYITDQDEVFVEEPNSEHTKVLPTRNGKDMSWYWSKQKFKQNKHNLVVKRGGNEPSVYKKRRVDGDFPTKKLKTVLKNPKYYNSRGTREIKDIFGDRIYTYPKPSELIKDFINITTNSGDTVLDFFAGSGTTSEAVHRLNREREEQVNYILVEMLDRALEITKERVKRTLYCNNWEDGVPQIEEQKLDGTQNGVASEENQLSFNVEYLEIESYEEALDALQFEDTQKTINKFNTTTLNYLLEFGTDKEPVFVESDQLSNPLDYKLSGTIESENIDIMTTFNYLIGLENWTKYNKSIEDTNHSIYEGEVDSEDVLILWRHNSNNISYQKEQDMLDYDDYDKVYINGDSCIKNSQPISPVFKRKMMLDKGDML